MPRIVPQPHGGSLTLQEPGDPSSNPHGRPKSAIGKVNDTLINAGEEPATRSDIEKTYVILAGLTEDSLEKLRDDPKNPILVRTVANALVSGWKQGLHGLEAILDRAIGKAVGSQEAPVFNFKDSKVIVQLPQNTKSQE